MVKKTNLEAVKNIAINLASVKPLRTDYSPMIINHPFTNSGYCGYMGEKGEQIILNICDNDDQLKLWQGFVIKQIKEANNLLQIYCIFNKPYALNFVRECMPYLSTEDYSKILAICYMEVEYPLIAPNMTKKRLVNMFKKADKKFLMQDDELKTLENFSDFSTIYRGVRRTGTFNALSWTTDYFVAKFFAERDRNSGKVFRAKIKKEHILAYFNGRKEHEVVVDPEFLIDVVELGNEENSENEI